MDCELNFNTNTKECKIIETNRDVIIYVCKDCDFITVGSDINKCIESRNSHMEKTNHTTKRIW